jgi:hypothetical protein
VKVGEEDEGGDGDGEIDFVFSNPGVRSTVGGSCRRGEAIGWLNYKTSPSTNSTNIGYSGKDRMHNLKWPIPQETPIFLLNSMELFSKRRDWPEGLLGGVELVKLRSYGGINSYSRQLLVECKSVEVEPYLLPFLSSPLGAASRSSSSRRSRATSFISRSPSAGLRERSRSRSRRSKSRSRRSSSRSRRSSSRSPRSSLRGERSRRRGGDPDRARRGDRRLSRSRSRSRPESNRQEAEGGVRAHCASS